MDSTRFAVDIAHRTWPELVPVDARGSKIVAGKLSEMPLWRLEGFDRLYGLRCWNADRVSQGQRAEQFVRQVFAPPLVNVPVPIRPTMRIDTQGQAWELTPWLLGEPTLVSEPTEAKLRAAGQALARLHERAKEHSVVESQSSVLNHIAELATLERDLASNQFSPESTRALEKLWPHDLPRIDVALREGANRVRPRLHNLADKPLRMQWIWGDAWHNNFLFEGDAVSGLIDFATVRVDTPVSDLARLMGSISQLAGVDPQCSMDAYESITPLTPLEYETMRVLLDSSTLLSLARWVRWLGVERREFPDVAAAVARFDHFVARMRLLLTGFQ